MAPQVSELAPVSVSADVTVRIFQLQLNNVTIELSSLGATITKILLPNYKHPERPRDDVVLSYASPKEQYQDKNSVYFGAIVGRVANRIKNGKFQLRQIEETFDGPVEKLETYQLDINNSPNHLHGGFGGFSTKNWEAAIVNDTVQFTLISPDGDQGYPGGIEVTAIYSLKANKHELGAKLHLSMTAKLLPGVTKATPISLAQHSYFNLASHSAPERILNHVLSMPNCHAFAPVDETSIPTREVRSVDGSSMDFVQGKIMSDALILYGQDNGLDPKMAKHNVDHVCTGDGIDAPIYGFDHNYSISQDQLNDDRLYIAGVLEHLSSGRLLIVSTNAPGVQLYTSNYLNGMNPLLCKDQFSYNRWQGICLETQAYPDSIIDDPCAGDEFEKGGCFILKPGGMNYLHEVVFEFSSTE